MISSIFFKRRLSNLREQHDAALGLGTRKLLCLNLVIRQGITKGARLVEIDFLLL